jgi:hypothetical protein
MKKFLAPLIAAAAIVSFGTGVRADTTWTFDWNQNVSNGTSTTSVLSDNSNYQLKVMPTSSSPSVTTPTNPGMSDIIAANLSWALAPNVTTPPADAFSKGQTFTLNGIVAGHDVSFTIGVTTPNISYDPPTGTISSLSKPAWTVVASSGTSWADASGNWNVAFDGVLPPGSGNTGTGSGTAGLGAVEMTVTTPAGAGHQPNPTPEPSTMLLSCVGLAFGGIATWRKRKQAVAA